LTYLDLQLVLEGIDLSVRRLSSVHAKRVAYRLKLSLILAENRRLQKAIL